MHLGALGKIKSNKINIVIALLRKANGERAEQKCGIFFLSGMLKPQNQYCMSNFKPGKEVRDNAGKFSNLGQPQWFKGLFSSKVWMSIVCTRAQHLLGMMTHMKFV